MQSNESAPISKTAARFILPALAIMLAAPIASYANIITLASVELDAMAAEAPQGVYSWSQTSVGNPAATGFPSLYGTAVSGSSAAYTGTNTSSVLAYGSATQGSICSIVLCSAPNPWISTDPFVAGAEASASLIYYIEVVPGPTPPPASFSGQVPVDLIYSAYTYMGASSGVATATVSAFAPQSPFVYQNSFCAGSACPPDSVSASNGYAGLTEYAAPGEEFAVQISVTGLLYAWGFWTATVDPEIYIDPSFQYADDFTLIASPALTSSSVPEPAYPWLLGSGLLLIGLLRRRTHR
ncbi:MAG TPA: hypothetical protein VEN79_18310 [Terriglobia bacterium]|nr:hypothetical protein [Terriglobia bacterium]